jgi:hypothetical protein
MPVVTDTYEIHEIEIISEDMKNAYLEVELQ